MQENEGDKQIQSIDLARTWALEELADWEIDLDSPAGRDFLARASAFGIMNVQPPRPELNTLTLDH